MSQKYLDPIFLLVLGLEPRQLYKWAVNSDPGILDSFSLHCAGRPWTQNPLASTFRYVCVIMSSTSGSKLIPFPFYHTVPPVSQVIWYEQCWLNLTHIVNVLEWIIVFCKSKVMGNLILEGRMLELPTVNPKHSISLLKTLLLKLCMNWLNE